MEMDHLITVNMLPDAFALKKGIGWVWLSPAVGLDHCWTSLLSVIAMFAFQSVSWYFSFLLLLSLVLPRLLSLTFFLFLSFCLAQFRFIARFFGYFPLWPVSNYFYSLRPVAHVNSIACTQGNALADNYCTVFCCSKEWPMTRTLCRVRYLFDVNQKVLWFWIHKLHYGYLDPLRNVLHVSSS